MYDECFIMSIVDQEHLLNWLLDNNAVDWFYMHVSELHQALIDSICDELHVNKLTGISYYVMVDCIKNNTMLTIIGMICNEIPDGVSGEKSIKLK